MQVDRNMQEKILVVDDDPDILDVLTMILESKDYQVITARDGIEALAKPKMDGFAVYKEIQDPKWSKHRDIPILILTSVREEASRRRYELETGVELDVEDYVEKPFPPDILLERVGELIKKKQNV